MHTQSEEARREGSGEKMERKKERKKEVGGGGARETNKKKKKKKRKETIDRKAKAFRRAHINAWSCARLHLAEYY